MVNEKTIPWFPCFPSKWLKAIAGMKPHVSLTYLVVCFRIYEIDGPCKDTADVLARRAGLKKNLVVEALKFLKSAGKLVEGQDGITNPFAEQVIQDRRAARLKTKKWNPHRIEKAQSDQQNRTPQLQLDITDTKESKKTDSEVVRVTAPHVIPEDWKLSDTDLAYAISKGFGENKARMMAESFFNHHSAKAQKFVKWDACWRTWVLNEIKFNGKPSGDGNYERPRQGGTPPGAGHRTTNADRVHAGLARSAAKRFGGEPPDGGR